MAPLPDVPTPEAVCPLSDTIVGVLRCYGLYELIWDAYACVSTLYAKMLLVRWAALEPGPTPVGD